MAHWLICCSYPLPQLVRCWQCGGMRTAFKKRRETKEARSEGMVCKVWKARAHKSRIVDYFSILKSLIFSRCFNIGCNIKPWIIKFHRTIFPKTERGLELLVKVLQDGRRRDILDVVYIELKGLRRIEFIPRGG